MSYLDTRMKDIYLGVDQSTPNIQHFGILGMKWGIRRYQNEDGTLTEEGKKRYVNKLARLDADQNSFKRQKEQLLNLTSNGRPLYTPKEIDDIIKSYDNLKIKTIHKLSDRPIKNKNSLDKLVKKYSKKITDYETYNLGLKGALSSPFQKDLKYNP